MILLVILFFGFVAQALERFNDEVSFDLLHYFTGCVPTRDGVHAQLKSMLLETMPSLRKECADVNRKALADSCDGQLQDEVDCSVLLSENAKVSIDIINQKKHPGFHKKHPGFHMRALLLQIETEAKSPLGVLFFLPGNFEDDISSIHVKNLFLKHNMMTVILDCFWQHVCIINKA